MAPRENTDAVHIRAVEGSFEEVIAKRTVDGRISRLVIGWAAHVA